MTTFQFQPKWKEELVVIASDGSFILDLTMGVLHAYLPTEENWPNIAPSWAKDLYPVLKEELEAWCKANNAGFVIDETIVEPVPEAPADEPGRLVGVVTNEIFRAQLESLAAADGGDAPAFLAGWAADRDLTDPDVTALEVSVFLTRNQLSNLDRQLDQLVGAFRSGGEDPNAFFDQLQLLAAEMSTDPDAVAIQYHPSSHGKYYGSHFIEDEELASMIEEARRISDWEERAPIYARIQQRIADLQPEIFGMLRQRQFAYQTYVKGYQDSPIRMTGEVDLYPLYIQP